MMRPPTCVRFARFCHALLASAFLACVVVQVFFVGVGIFGANWSFHTHFVALFAVLAPVTGLTATTVLIGLVLYSLVILVRNFLAGLLAVPADVREAATGMGYGAGRLFLRVELPLALPAFMAGLRIATVSTVALATVGVIVGHGGLGQLIVGGFAANFYRAEIVTGAVGCVLLALLADLLLAGVERAVTPWARVRT